MQDVCGQDEPAMMVVRGEHDHDTRAFPTGSHCCALPPAPSSTMSAPHRRTPRRSRATCARCARACSRSTRPATRARCSRRSTSACGSCSAPTARTSSREPARVPGTRPPHPLPQTGATSAVAAPGLAGVGVGRLAVPRHARAGDDPAEGARPARARARRRRRQRIRTVRGRPGARARGGGAAATAAAAHGWYALAAPPCDTPLILPPEQDVRLDSLAQSIGRQHYLSTQINDELETHTAGHLVLLPSALRLIPLSTGPPALAGHRPRRDTRQPLTGPAAAEHVRTRRPRQW
jgi:hypothetical protein